MSDPRPRGRGKRQSGWPERRMIAAFAHAARKSPLRKDDLNCDKYESHST